MLNMGNTTNQVEFYVNGKKLKFLVDTGASLCAIKFECLDSKQQVINNKIKISGVGGNLTSGGYVNLLLVKDRVQFKEKFHILQNLSFKADGIIGENFLSKYNAIINYENSTLCLKNLDKIISVPLQLSSYINEDENYSNNLNISPRCETIHWISTNLKDDCVILAKELCEGVFMAGSIARPQNGRIPVKILNTTEDEVKITDLKPEVHDLREYEYCKFEDRSSSPHRVKTLFELLKFHDLTKEEQISIENICAKFPDVFHLPNDKLSVANLYKQNICLKKNATPVYVKPYRLPQALKHEIETQISDMLKDGIIEEAQSEWSSPILIVPKKVDRSGKKKWRVVIDYRRLNERIQDDKFPLPNITEILDSLSGAIYFSHLDLSQGYYQAELDHESRPYTAFTTNKAQYQMTRLPMGLKTSPNNFSRLMTVAMSGLNYENCFVYLDDLVVFGRNLQSHNANLIKVFERWRKVNLKLNPSKCEFLKKEILYLGHIITAEGILPDPEKIRVLRDYPVPTNSNEVKRFVAFANYYRKYIPNFSQKSAPLNNLSRKNVPFVWTSDCQNSFETLKEALMQPPVLQYPDFSASNEFRLQTDASGMAIGAVLSNKDDRPIAFASRSLNKAERNYNTVEKELLAVVWAVKYFRPYLFGRHFKIFTDHKPLVYLFNHTNPSTRLTKFRLCLEEYDFTVEYVRGRENVTADALSRVIVTSNELKGMNEQVYAVTTRAQTRSIKDADKFSDTKQSTTSRPDQPRVVEMLKKPKGITELKIDPNQNLRSIRQLNNHVATQSESIIYVPKLHTIFVNPNPRSTITRVELLRDVELLCKEINITEIIILKDENNQEFVNILARAIGKSSNWTGPRICIIKGAQRINDDDMKKLILNDFHLLPTSGHAGVQRMISNIKKYYYWSGLTEDVKKFVRKCDSCQRYKFSKPIKEPMMITSTAYTSFEKVYLDIVGPLNSDANKNIYILTLQCDLTKFVEAYPLPSKDTVTVAKAFVENFILRYGIPREVATDKGTEFISYTMREICKLLHVNQVQSTAYHHQSIGSLENSHKVLGAYLRTLTKTQNSSWSTWIPYWCFCYNTTVHCETKYTPYELVFGKPCILPNNLTTNIDPVYNIYDYPVELRFRLQRAQQDARNNLVQRKVHRKQIYDKYVNPVKYKKNDLVLIKSETGDKLSAVFQGPYKVLEDCAPNVRVLKNDKEYLVHKNRTKLYYC